MYDSLFTEFSSNLVFYFANIRQYIYLPKKSDMLQLFLGKLITFTMQISRAFNTIGI